MVERSAISDDDRARREFDEGPMHTMSSTTLRSRRSGFTLKDLLIVIAILAVLAAFLLPSVRQAREAARRTQCKCHLKQLGLAFHNYHDTYNHFPAGFLLPSDGPYAGWGWAVKVLPYLDQQLYYDKIHFEGGLQHEYNQPQMKHRLSTFRCASEPVESDVSHLAVVTSEVKNGVVIPATVDAVNLFPRSSYFAVVGYLLRNWVGSSELLPEAR